MNKKMTNRTEKNMTAKVSCFVRAYHYKNNSEWIFADALAEKMLGTGYEAIATHMSSGISFFCPGFEGTKEEALRWIADNQLSPSVLGRSAFCERMLANEIKLGCKQYLIFGAGYDTFAYRNDNPDIRVFELDRAEMLADKKARLQVGGIRALHAEYIDCNLESQNWKDALADSTYEHAAKSFCSMLGLSYYMTKDSFENLLCQSAEMLSQGSAIVFDYPMLEGSTETEKNEKLAAAAGESMKSAYTYGELEKILERCGLLIYEHLDAGEMTKQYFEKYNACYPERKMCAPKGVGYCMAVKGES